MIDLCRRLRERGLTILVIEHLLRAIMALSDRIVVLDHGEKIAEGVPAAVSRDPPRSSRPTSAPRPGAMAAEPGRQAAMGQPGDAAPVLPAGGAVPAPPVLLVRDLHAGYGDVPVLRGSR